MKQEGYEYFQPLDNMNSCWNDTDNDVADKDIEYIFRNKLHYERRRLPIIYNLFQRHVLLFLFVKKGSKNDLDNMVGIFH